MSQDYIVINHLDSVGVALNPLKKGAHINIGENKFVLREPIAQGHKFSLYKIMRGENIIKYGYPIGHAIIDIEAGSHVHIHNTRTNLSCKTDYAYQPVILNFDAPPEKTFMGYRRASGEVGVRNEIWIIPTVGCVNGIGKNIERIAAHRFANRMIDGIYFFSHPYGCSQMGDDQSSTQRILANLAAHPNAGGVLILGLGCENNNINEFKKVFTDYDKARVQFISAQEFGDETETALTLLEELVSLCEHDKRESFNVSVLRVGLKCGGSDGLSGVTANPLVGVFSDLLNAAGGTTVLTEIPEVFGAEQILLNRCVTKNIFDDVAAIINNFKAYYERHNQVIYENPSPGNKTGGITTLEDKSLGCVQKGGSAPVKAALRYGERIHGTGLHILECPGNDIIAVTALAAAHVHITLFTTGRGTPVGSPVPVIKIASNNDIAARKKNWIDFNAGKLINGLATLDKYAYSLYNYVLDVASGKKTLNELNGFRDTAIFKNGVTL